MHGFLGITYHYLREKSSQELFPRILGNKMDDLRRHIIALRERYYILSPEEAFDYMSGKKDFRSRQENLGVLLTFDDGVSDHYKAAEILAEHNIFALFFIPTCIVADGEPASPNIIHYALAIYGIDRFLSFYREALEGIGLSVDAHDIIFKRGVDNPWDTIGEIKKVLKYRLNYTDSRKILMHMYRNRMLVDNPDILKFMHLTSRETSDMVKMGHSLGSHTHTHVSVAATELSQIDYEKEMDFPKRYLEERFKTNVRSISYPYGLKEDCLTAASLLERSGGYEFAFSVEPKVNEYGSNGLNLGRYMLSGSDTPETMMRSLELIEGGRGREAFPTWFS
ncbi:MAG: hypothetical protein A3H69_01990 [Candidatus Sungbacteria bacterium RIFCSPLOWO2_02_FULL_47_9]|uniref:NodB homology domain-containing protein n=1 Tax=Candidatus Sungbacteria bacterium RIFCSPHIGHO2_01_FULL_47_32 TaxID=1802264 RepID=A0A1G2K6Q2_9BACT|nr:MAG: hypothetical protein UX72_C0019G0010 [Parcubacteria group bacterium GW2011_GWA2_47_10]OGZ95124.1 MAG: hypothetical protein A2633_06345 [Candidatus Sungbacteria bacterium RIFCSPHIGHO2_01_FULL_47_32]OGZ98197.1 MAG: hypothetical protein A3D57_03210 [Candidatus Sungbacteria bacterium RIFCSPHIGHO2_02_FULL_46_12]OHA05604.1 MAG: hypothetical protein A3A28_00340 [Candidatus Sungbacteria bacterium RIFCSPLOWO2_01_FULL_47_32]OHA12275.1 MAG: hypothetical protein A3H69_01990 [Candidatus Sungbacteria